jgi:hypothetical protein
MSKYSNILKVSSISDHALNLMKRIFSKLDLANNHSQNLINNVFDYKNDSNLIIDTISNSNYPLKSLGEITKDDKNSILTLNVIDYLPNDILDFSQVFCPHCRER